MTISYHLAIPTLACIIGLVMIFVFRKKLLARNRLFWISAMVFLILYLLIVGGALYNDIYYQYEANRLDLNKDGLFSKNEMTDELNEIMTSLNNDTGRNFSFITGFIFAFIISTVVYMVGLFFKRGQKNPNS
ncbi:MAG: hypothetical protein WCY89_11350 [Flavobacteriaceae bacterium]